MVVSVESQREPGREYCAAEFGQQAQVSRRASLLIWLAASLAGWAIAFSAGYGLYEALS